MASASVLLAATIGAMACMTVGLRACVCCARCVAVYAGLDILEWPPLPACVCWLPTAACTGGLASRLPVAARSDNLLTSVCVYSPRCPRPCSLSVIHRTFPHWWTTKTRKLRNWRACCALSLKPASWFGSTLPGEMTWKFATCRAGAELQVLVPATEAPISD